MKAILVGVSTNYDRYDLDYSLDELKNLAEALDINVVDRVTQKLDKPNTKTYVGKGKLTEINFSILAHDANIVIFNDELTPSQLRNVSQELKVECIDRSYLILKIFEERASTKEATFVSTPTSVFIFKCVEAAFNVFSSSLNWINDA